MKSQILSKYNMTDIGEVHYYLGIEVRQNPKNRRIWLCQSKYVENILNRFWMQRLQAGSDTFFQLE